MFGDCKLFQISESPLSDTSGPAVLLYNLPTKIRERYLYHKQTIAFDFNSISIPLSPLFDFLLELKE